MARHSAQNMTWHATCSVARVVRHATDADARLVCRGTTTCSRCVQRMRRWRGLVCSDDFCHLTQYPRTEVLGRNCKFLQASQRASPASQLAAAPPVTRAPAWAVAIGGRRLSQLHGLATAVRLGASAVQGQETAKETIQSIGRTLLVRPLPLVQCDAVQQAPHNMHHPCYACAWCRRWSSVRSGIAECA